MNIRMQNIVFLGEDKKIKIITKNSRICRNQQDNLIKVISVMKKMMN